MKKISILFFLSISFLSANALHIVKDSTYKYLLATKGKATYKFKQKSYVEIFTSKKEFAQGRLLIIEKDSIVIKQFGRKRIKKKLAIHDISSITPSIYINNRIFILLYSIVSAFGIVIGVPLAKPGTPPSAMAGVVLISLLGLSFLSITFIMLAINGAAKSSKKTIEKGWRFIPKND